MGKGEEQMQVIQEAQTKLSKIDSKIKFSLLLGLVLLVAVVPETLILFLSVIVLLCVKSLWSGVYYVFSTIIRFFIGCIVLLLVLYLVMLVVVYFFT